MVQLFQGRHENEDSIMFNASDPLDTEHWLVLRLAKAIRTQKIVCAYKTASVLTISELLQKFQKSAQFVVDTKSLEVAFRKLSIQEFAEDLRVRKSQPMAQNCDELRCA